jgi:small GTP-binding protein
MNDPLTFEEFEKKFSKVYEEKAPEFDSHINIALVGKVNTGKSSLLNAILCCERNNPLAEVSAKSGVTTKITAYRLDDKVFIIDCPGLNDVRKENQAETEDFLSKIDLGILVVTGSVDSSQKANYDDLKNSTGKTIVILNKIDEWDDFEESVLEEIVEQWKSVLCAETLFPTCTKGYDPKAKRMDLRGVDNIRDEIFKFLQVENKESLFAHHIRDKEKKEILLARYLKERKKKAHKIIHGHAAAAAATSAAFGSIPIIGPITGDSVGLILITERMGQSLSRDVFDRNIGGDEWRGFALGMLQFYLGALTIKTVSSVIPYFGSAVNATVSVATVEVIGWTVYHILDEGKDPDKLSKEEIKKALSWAKKQ